MRPTTALSVFAVLIWLGLNSSVATAQGNPCAAKAMNPCGDAANPCNPCGGKSAAIPTVAVNPCHAKHGTVFYIADPMKRDSVTFTSEAPLEDIVGTTNEVVGYAVFDPDNPSRGIRGAFRVPVASLNTGIPLRDEHLRSPDWMNAEQHPEIIFNISNVMDVREHRRSDQFQTYDMTLVGPLQINGRKNTMEVPARITFLRQTEQTAMRLPGNLLAIRAAFPVRLSTNGITGGEMGQVIGSRLSDSIAIDVRLMGTDASPSASATNPCNPCGAKAGNPCNPCAK
jgi:polyisoprenoid-binding protein YceI